MSASKAKGSKKAAPKKGAEKARAKAAPKAAKVEKPRKAAAVAAEPRATAKAPAEKPAKGARPTVEKPARPAPKEKEPKLRRAAPPIEAGEEEADDVEVEDVESEDVAEAEGEESEDVGDITGRSEMKALLDRGREKGFVTFDEVNDALPNDIGADQMDDVMSMFGEHDIEVVDGQVKKLPDKPPEPEPKDEKEEKEGEEEDAGYGKSNDPVRLYLRKMGSVSLLTREGEVEIAKRIEEGEKEILAAVLSSSISTRIILDLGDRLRKGKI
ncbi:MAG TPA: RNA polymerase sigma factor region1.1 domain-containing protein, partial [Anaeromyxobacteraceae bacterium]|nr:RNA polymerase sigma factor region1.1 domain-containing protein [Anaeromyxobacteraceae bacterium]